MNRNIKYALLASLMVAIGMLAGFRLKQEIPRERREQINNGFQKIQNAIWFVERNYVDEPNTKKMVDDAIVGMLDGLDPHSFYIPTKEMKQMEEQMQGSFEGVGIEFNLLEDTIYVVAALSGGPSEMAGIHAGDRLVKIEDTIVAGVSITNADVMKKLRGPKGSHVIVSVLRRGHDNLIKFDIKRDKIPLSSVDFSYMINKDIGYLKISRFAGTTHDEFRKHTKKLKAAGMTGMILDLRGNPGGYMEMAEKIADEFLSEGKLVVYTDGRTYDSKSKYKANSYLDLFEDGPLIVLIDYGSASASEIVSGAVQDWDRGLIVGVRSFGKGLVQTQREFSDGSAMRLVISQYYTPSGRCIQKPFNMSSKEYDQELIKRFESGELYDASKIDLPDSLKFKTNAGRPVYGGGGIVPDVFVSRDTTKDSDYLSDLIAHNAFRKFSFHFADAHPEMENKYPDAASFLKGFKVDNAVMEEFKAYATSKGADFDAEGYQISKRDIHAYVKSFVGKHYFKDDAFYPAFHETDNVLQRAVNLIPEARELQQKGSFTLKN
ncbi:MAG TPA: S41 family peptidase [Bacteroidetes bacterium]|nr:S41 family peptidase [Bacteroidota bacterium]